MWFWNHVQEALDSTASLEAGFFFFFIILFLPQMFSSETSLHQRNIGTMPFIFLISSQRLQIIHLSWEWREGKEW
jgi:hypothetical protein